MADWTDISTTVLEPGKPIRSVDGIALRDNIIAITEGASGAPRVQNAAMGSDSVDNANVVNGTLGAEKFQTGNSERDWVLARTSDASVGAVGTYAFLRATAGEKEAGETESGSNLEYSNASGNINDPAGPSGTWRCMGSTNNPTGDDTRTTLFLRIS